MWYYLSSCWQTQRSWGCKNLRNPNPWNFFGTSPSEVSFFNTRFKFNLFRIFYSNLNSYRINSANFEAVVVTNTIPQDKHMRECQKIQVAFNANIDCSGLNRGHKMLLILISSALMYPWCSQRLFDAPITASPSLTCFPTFPTSVSFNFLQGYEGNIVIILQSISFSCAKCKSQLWCAELNSVLEIHDTNWTNLNFNTGLSFPISN